MNRDVNDKNGLPQRHLSFEAWVDQVYQVMINNHPGIFCATDKQAQLHRSEIDWAQWQPWYDAGLSPVEAVEKSLITN